jgi:hypothetical protein
MVLYPQLEESGAKPNSISPFLKLTASRDLNEKSPYEDVPELALPGRGAPKHGNHPGTLLTGETAVPSLLLGAFNLLVSRSAI